MAKDVNINLFIHEGANTATSPGKTDKDILNYMKEVSQLLKTLTPTKVSNTQTAKTIQDKITIESKKQDSIQTKQAITALSTSANIYKRLNKEFLPKEQIQYFNKLIGSTKNLSQNFENLNKLSGETLRNERQKIQNDREYLIKQRTLQQIEGTYNPRAKKLLSLGGLVKASAIAFGTGAIGNIGNALQTYGATRPGLPLQGGTQITQSYIQMQNSIRSSVANGVTMGLGGVGLAIGGPIGAAISGIAAIANLGAKFVTAQAGGVGLAANTSAIMAQVSRAQGVPGASSIHTANLKGGIFNAGTKITNQMQTWNKNPRINLQSAFKASLQYSRYGLPLTAAEGEYYTNLDQMGYDVSGIAASQAFLRRRYGKDFSSQLLSSGAAAGIGPQEMASQTAMLTQSSALSNPVQAMSFIKGIVGMGSAFQQTATRYQQSGPIEQFQQRMTGKAFGVNTADLYSGNIEKRNRALSQFNNLQSKYGKQMGSFLGEIITGSGSSYYSVANAAQQEGMEGISSMAQPKDIPFTPQELARNRTQTQQTVTAKQLNIQQATIQKLDIQDFWSLMGKASAFRTTGV